MLDQNFYYIGTKTGLVCKFNKEEVLVGSKNAINNTMTALAISQEGDILLCGHDNGALVALDTNLKVLMIISGVQGSIISINILKTKPDILAIIISNQGNTYILKSSKTDLIEKDYILGNPFDIKTFTKKMRTFCSKTAMEQELLKNIVFLKGTDGITVINLEPTPDVVAKLNKPKKHPLQMVFKISRPEDVPEGVLPQLLIGLGRLAPDQLQMKSYCIVIWDWQLLFYEFTNNFNIITFEEVVRFKMDSKILYANWIYDGIILMVDETKKINLFNCEEINYHGQKKRPSSSSQEVFIYAKESIALEKFWDQRLYNKNLQNKISIDYEYGGEFMLVIERDIWKIRIFDAKEYFGILSSKTEWLEYFSIANAIFNRNVKEIRGIPIEITRRKNEFFNIFRIKIDELLNKTYQINQYEQLIIIIIDFLVSIDDQEFLFGEVIKTHLNRLGLVDTLYRLLEPFIEQNLITKIPTALELNSILKFYCMKNKSSLMQQLIYNLNLEYFNNDEMTVIFLEHNLYVSLLYLDNGSMLPFGTLLENFTNERDISNANAKAKFYGYRTLWYVKCYLKRQMVTSIQVVNVDNWKRVTCSILMAIFDQNYLRLFSNLDVSLTINVILLFFYDEPAKVLQENKYKYSLTNVILEQNNTLFDQIYIIIEDMLMKKSVNNKLNRDVFAFFLVKVIQSNKCKNINESTCYDTAEYLIKIFDKIDENMIINNYKMFLPNTYNKSQKMNPNKEILKHVNKHWILNKKLLMITCLLNKTPSILAQEDKFNHILTLSTTSKQSFELIEVQCFLYNFIKNHIKVSNLYIDSSNLKIFEYAIQVMKSFIIRNDFSDQYVQYKTYLLSKMKILVTFLYVIMILMNI